MISPPQPVPILFLIDELDAWRGTETHLFRLLNTLDRSRFYPIVGILNRHSLKEDFFAAGIETHCFNIHKTLHPLGAVGICRLTKFVYKKHIRLIISYHTASDLLAPIVAVLSKMLLKQVVAVSSRRDEGFTKKPIHYRLQRFLNYGVSGMISVSHAVTYAVERTEGYPLNRQRVIWNGEDLKRFHPAAHPSKVILEPFGILESDCVATCLAGLDPIKDHISLIKGFMKISEQHPNLHLLLIGEGKQRPILEALAAPFISRIHFAGHRQDAPELLRASDIYIQTSLSEGFSNAILQAMASGLPIIATKVGGNSEMVSSNTGFLIETKDIDAISKTLDILVKDPSFRKKLGFGARAWAVEHGSIEGMCNAYMDAFDYFVK